MTGTSLLPRKVGALLLAGLLALTTLGAAAVTPQTALADDASSTAATKATPKKPTIKKLSAATNTVTVKWAKQKNVSGYQIKYAKKKSMAGAKTVTAGKNATSKKISGLKAGTKYYVQVRAYKTVKGEKRVSPWSAKKSVTTKAKAKSKASKKASSDTVYITKSGKKYHKDGCRSLSRSKIKISKSDAVGRGYTACKVCRP